MVDLVGNPKDRFCCDTAHIISQGLLNEFGFPAYPRVFMAK